MWGKGGRLRLRLRRRLQVSRRAVADTSRVQSGPWPQRRPGSVVRSPAGGAYASYTATHFELPYGAEGGAIWSGVRVSRDVEPADGGDVGAEWRLLRAMQQRKQARFVEEGGWGRIALIAFLAEFLFFGKQVQ